MNSSLRVFVSALILMAVSAPWAVGQAMFKQPIWVPADFLQFGGHNEAWLSEAAGKLGVTNGIVMGKGMVGAQNIKALQVLNRIRTFASLDAESLRPPYFDLMMKAADGEVYRCITKFPKSIVPSISSSDFATPFFSDTDADKDLASRCKVIAKKDAEYSGLDRDVYRERYFGPGGHLRDEFIVLNTIPAFIAEAFDLGFYVLQGDLTGRLVIDNE